METREEKLINKIQYLITFDHSSCNCSPTDLWINNSCNNDGEDIKVECIKTNGLDMEDGDFYDYEDLNEEELERVLDALSPNYITDKAEDKRINDTKELYNLVCRTLTDFEDADDMVEEPITAEDLYNTLVKVQNYMCEYGLDL